MKEGPEKLLGCDVGTRAFEAGSGTHLGSLPVARAGTPFTIAHPREFAGHDSSVSKMSRWEIAITARLIVDLEAQGGSGPYG